MHNEIQFGTGKAWHPEHLTHRKEVQQPPAVHISHWYLSSPTLGMGQFAMTGNLLTKLNFQWPYILWSHLPGPIKGQESDDIFIYLFACLSLLH